MTEYGLTGIIALVVAVMTLLIYFVDLHRRNVKRRNKRLQARYRAYRKARREQEEKQSKQWKIAYFISLVNGG